MSLRTYLDKLAPQFEKGGKYQALFPLYEAIDTALYTPGYTTKGASHVRDGMDLKRMMITVWAMADGPLSWPRPANAPRAWASLWGVRSPPR